MCNVLHWQGRNHSLSSSSSSSSSGAANAQRTKTRQSSSSAPTQATMFSKYPAPQNQSSLVSVDSHTSVWNDLSPAAIQRGKPIQGGSQQERHWERGAALGKGHWRGALARLTDGKHGNQAEDEGQGSSTGGDLGVQDVAEWAGLGPQGHVEEGKEEQGHDIERHLSDGHAKRHRDSLGSGIREGHVRAWKREGVVADAREFCRGAGPEAVPAQRELLEVVVLGGPRPRDGHNGDDREDERKAQSCASWGLATANREGPRRGQARARMRRAVRRRRCRCADPPVARLQPRRPPPTRPAPSRAARGSVLPPGGAPILVGGPARSIRGRAAGSGDEPPPKRRAQASPHPRA